MSSEPIKVEHNGNTHVMVKANDVPHTWRVFNEKKSHSYFMPTTEKWSPLITITLKEGGGDQIDATVELLKLLEFIEVRDDPSLLGKS